MADTENGGAGNANSIYLHQPHMPQSPAKALEPEPAPVADLSGSGLSGSDFSGEDKPAMASHRPKLSISGFLNTLAALFMLGVLAVAGSIYYGKQIFETAGPLQTQRVVNIKPGMGVGTIAHLLQEEGIIENSYIFRGGAVLEGASGHLKAGEYSFEPGISMREVLQKLTTGSSISYKLTLPEGLTTMQILARINADPVLLGEVPETPGEGTLLPETYNFTRGMTRKAIIGSMREAQQRLLDELWPKRRKNLPITSREEAIILASIVEKETGQDSERAHIAGVFINRLEKGMRLQSDPTIIYGLVGGKGSLGRGIRLSELTKKTPYNTYVIKGLPPGPIANPGKAAIAAVLQPMKTDDLFFVADGTGGHAFAKTLKEHRANVAKWRKIESARRKAAAAKNAETPDSESKPQ